MNRNSRIRLNIMMIAVIGGLAFLVYLTVNVMLAMVNGKRLDELQNRYYPIIEELRQVKQELASLREGYAATIGLGDRMLLEEMGQIEITIRERFKRIGRLQPNDGSELQQIRKQFDDYAGMISSLANQVMDNPNQLQSSQQSIEQALQRYDRLLQRIDRLQQQSQKTYATLLRTTNEAVKHANWWGAVVGVMVILILVLLAWLVTRRVLLEINKSDRLKDEFLATISHELRTPMNGIIGAHSILRETELSEDQRSWLEVATSSSNGMIRIIDDVLQYSEVSAIADLPLLDEFRLRAGIEKLMESFRSDFAEKKLYLNFRADPILDALIVSNENKIRFVVRQLLSNALKFTERGGAELSIRKTDPPAGSDSTWIKITVQDSGPGVADQQLIDLAMPFRQLDGTFSRRHQGMGIGLATCAAIAALMRGTLNFQNRPSGGLQVEFIIPVKLVQEAGPCLAPPPLAVATPKTGYASSKTIMIVEDNEVSLTVIKAFLRRMGLNSVSAKDGLEALDLLKARPVDLILMDCQMPVMDGFEATMAIRKLPPPLRDTHIVALTANASAADKQHCLSVGMDDFLAKPVELKDLRSVVQTYLFNAGVNQ